MAPLKQPGTLRSLAQVRLANLTRDACTKHEETIVSYDTSQRVKIVEEIQEFIGALPEMLLNEVCQEIVRLLPPGNNDKKNSTFAYAVVMHKDVNQITIEHDLLRQTHGTESFWNDRFRNMSKLTEVNFYQSFELSFVSTITESCPNLKKFTFPSFWQNHTFSQTVAIAAISLLTRCSQLSYIDCDGVSDVHEDSMQHLLESLPGLEVCILPVDVSLGDLLTRMRNNGSVQLQLRHFCEWEATPTHIDSMMALCPQVTHLTLLPVSAEASDEIMDILKNSSLKIQTLEFDFRFPIIQSSFESLLESKALHLKSLDVVLGDKCIIHFDVVRSIGEFCPHLEILNIYMESVSNALHLPEISTPIVVPPGGTRPFQKLSTLEFEVYGSYQISSSMTRSLIYCLENSVHLKSLRLKNVFKPNDTLGEVVQILASGRIQELKLLELHCDGVLFTKQMVQYLYESFHQLTRVEFNPGAIPRDVEEYLEVLTVEAKKNNIDFVVKYR